MNKAFGVQVTVTTPGKLEPKIAPVIVVARDEQDAAVVAAEAAGAGAQAGTLRELTKEEVTQHNLDLGQHGTVKSLALLNL
jgi:hypothetical protein